MAFAIMRCEKLKSVSTATHRSTHNSRKNGAALSDKGEPKVITLLMKDSESMQECKNMSFAEFHHKQTKDQKVRKNAVLGFEVILTFSPGGVHPDNLKEWANENMKFLSDVFGEKNLYSVKLHLSETTPHIHAICGAIDEKGKLAANNIITGPEHLRRLQTEYAQRMERFGLERGISKKLTKKKHTKLQEWYAKQVYKDTRLTAYEKTFGTEDTWNLDTKLEFMKNSDKQPQENNISDKNKETITER